MKPLKKKQDGVIFSAFVCSVGIPHSEWTMKASKKKKKKKGLVWNIFQRRRSVETARVSSDETQHGSIFFN